MTQAEGESVQFLIAQAMAAGFKVTSREIERWNYAKLLPDPRQISLGRDGSHVIYPLSTSNQLIALCQIKRKHPKLKDVGWHLWIRKFPIEESVWRPTIDKTVEWWDKTALLMERFFYQKNKNELSYKAIRLFESNKDKRTNDPLLKQIRRRIGSPNIPSVMFRAYELLSGRLKGSIFENLEEGETDKLPKGDRKIFSDAMGFKRAWTDHLPGGEPILGGSVVSPLLELSKALMQNRSITDASISEIEETRDELTSLLTVLAQGGYLLEQAYGKNAFGLGMIQYLAKENRPKQQAILISLWYKIRYFSNFKDGIAAIIALKDQTNSMYHKFRSVQDKAREIPALRELLTPKRLKRIFQGPEEQEAFSLELGRILQSLPNPETDSE